MTAPHDEQVPIPGLVRAVGTPGVLTDAGRQEGAAMLLCFIVDHHDHSPSLRAFWGEMDVVERYTLADIVRVCEDIVAGTLPMWGPHLGTELPSMTTVGRSPSFTRRASRSSTTSASKKKRPGAGPRRPR